LVTHGRTGSVWAWSFGGGGAQPQSRLNETDLYQEDDDPVFNPSEYHPDLDNGSWMAMPQPGQVPKQVNGPLDDAATPDLTQFVYFSADAGSPLAGRLAAVKVSAGVAGDEMDDLVTVYDGYDLFGHATKVVDPRGVVTRYMYDDLGRMESVTIDGNCDHGLGFDEDPLCSQDLTTSFSYVGTTSRVDVVTLPSGSVVQNQYEAWEEPHSWGRLVNTMRGPSLESLVEGRWRTLDDDSGVVTGETLDSWFGPTRTTHWAITREYDAAGRLGAVSRPRFEDDPDPAVEEYQYDAAGHLEATTDALHDLPNLWYEYDALGRLSVIRQLAEPEESRWIETSYGYDIHGNLVNVTDANSNVTHYAVDDFGQPYKIDSPVSGVSKLMYDAAGRLVWREDARGVTESREYAADVGPASITFNDPGGDNPESIAIGYRLGFKDSASTGSVQESWTYDRRGSVLRYARDPETVLYNYNADGALRRRERGAGNSEVVNYGLDFAGRPISVDLTLPGQLNIELARSAQYLPYGPMKYHYRPSAFEERSYDWQYQMVSTSAWCHRLPVTA
jgi:YD repeat-containing protein